MRLGMVTMVGCVVMGMYTLLDLAGRWGVDRFHHSVAECGGCESIQIGRVAEADLRAGDGGTTACYTYSRSKGEI
jgi:hypothetical protein